MPSNNKDSKVGEDFLRLMPKFFERSFDIIFMQNPLGTSLGFFSGIVLSGILDIVAVYDENLAKGIAVIHMYHCICLCVLLAHFVWWYKFRPEVPDELQQRIDRLNTINRQVKLSNEDYKSLLAIVLQPYVNAKASADRPNLEEQAA